MPQPAPAPKQGTPDRKNAAAQPTGFDGLLDEWDGSVNPSRAVEADAISPRQVMALQRMVGNNAVQRMLYPPDLTTTPPVTPVQPNSVRRTPTSQVVGKDHDEIAVGDELAIGKSPKMLAPPMPGAGTLQRSPAPKISNFASSAGSTVIQRRTVLASKPGHYHTIEGPPQGNLKQKIKQIRKAQRTKKFKRFDDINISDDDSEHIKDGMGQPVWYRAERGLNVMDNHQYVLGEKVLASFSSAPLQNDIDESDPELGNVSKTDNFEGTGGIVNEVDNSLVDVLRGYTLKEEVRGEDLTENETKIQTEGNIAEGGLWALGGGFGMVSGILGMAASLKDITSDEKSTWEKVEAAFNLVTSGSDYLGGAMGISGGVSQIVNSQQTEDTPEYDLSSGVAGWSLGFQGMFTSLTNGIKTILDVVSLIRMIVREVTDKVSFDRDEWLAKVGSLLMNAMETAKGVVTTFRVMWELINDSVTGAFELVVPGFDIAISAVKSIFQGYYLAKSAFHWYRMAKAGHEEKNRLNNSGFTKDSIKEARKFYGEREGLVSNTGKRLGKNDKAIKERTQKHSKLQSKDPSSFDFINNRNLKQQQQLKTEIGVRDNESREITTRRDNAMQEMSDYENNQIDSSGSQVPQPNQAPVNHPTRLQLSELNLTKELSSANAKRVTRQAIHISTNLVKIAGAIVVIVGGTGAPAGVALKAAAAGVDISLPFFRSLKQYGRKKAGKAQAKGKNNLTTKVFNANKSDIAKLDHRKRQAVTILMMVANLNAMMPNAQDKGTRNQQREALAQRVEVIERYMYAAGVSPKKLYRENGKPAEQIKLLVEAMCKRELF